MTCRVRFQPNGLMQLTFCFVVCLIFEQTLREPNTCDCQCWIQLACTSKARHRFIEATRGHVLARLLNAEHGWAECRFIGVGGMCRL